MRASKKKNILLLLMTPLFFMAADAQGQEQSAKEICSVDGTNSYFKILNTPVSVHNAANEENKPTAQAEEGSSSVDGMNSNPQILDGAISLQNTAYEENKSIAQADAQAEEQSAKESRCPDGMNFYAKIFGGVNFLQNTTIDGNKTSYQPGYIFSGSLGYCWRYYGLRLEAEYAFRRNAVKKIHFITQGSSTNGHFQTSSYMANLLWDMPLCAWGCTSCKIKPFIGAGIGYDFKKVYSSNSRVDFHQKFNHFSWQAMAGFAYPIFRNTEISLEYKFHDGGPHFYNHALGVGLMYKFGFIK